MVASKSMMIISASAIMNMFYVQDFDVEVQSAHITL